MKNVSLWAVPALLLCATSWAQTLPPPPSPPSTNTCTATVDSPFQGANSASDPSADGVLWPPNHNFRTIRISAEDMAEQPCNVTINDVKQDEVVSGTGAGSGATSPDAANCDNSGNTSKVDLRGERSGLGDGRYYHVLYTMEDPSAAGVPQMGDARILVPHDQGIVHVGTYVDEGPVFESSGAGVITCNNPSPLPSP